MTYTVTMTNAAKEDITEIFCYIAVDLQSIESAKGQIKRISRAIQSLDTMPERHRVIDNKKISKLNVRVMPVDNYLIFYRPNNQNMTVNIVRILYKGRDAERQLEKN